jgi:hypothetical protein
MRPGDSAESAGKLIASKADQILARLDPAARGAEEQRRHASALLHLATKASGDSSYAARAIDDARKINQKDRELAGKMVSRRASAAYGKHQLQDAIALYGIALSIDEHGDWHVLRGFAQVQAQDFAGAKASFESVEGYHAKDSAFRAKLCELRLKGVDLATMPAPQDPGQAQLLYNFLFHMKGAHSSPEYQARREREGREQLARWQAQAAQAAEAASLPIPLNRDEVSGKFIAKVAQAIASKADRVLAGIRAADRKADEKRRHASALLMLATEVSANAAFADRAPDKAAAITDQDRERAATEANSLASRAEGAGKSRDAIAYYDIALSLRHEGYWLYLKGLLQQRLQDYAAAVKTFEAVKGTYAQYAAPLAEQCRGQQAGKPEPAVYAGHTGMDTKAERTPQQQADLDLASDTAQAFAELLACGDFAAADAMLTKEAQPAGGAEDLRTSYLNMTQREDDGSELDEAEVMVMEAHPLHEEDRSTDALGWVYVAISGRNFNEAVTVVVTRVAGIGSIQWGRP